MDTVLVGLENCYGIKKLNFEFDLVVNDRSKGVYAIYAPNGFMKTSFARTFSDIADASESKDLIFPERTTVRNVLSDGQEITAEEVMVIKPYDESYSSQQVSVLLVNETLKRQYETALKDIDKARSDLVKELKKLSGLSGRTESIESVLCESFDKEAKGFLELLIELQSETEDYSGFSGFVYKYLFNDKVMGLIKSGSFSQELNDYIQTYEELIDQSPVLSRKFNHQNAEVVSKKLNDTGFFTASHTVNLSANGTKTEISNHEELNGFLKQEQDRVLNNPDLERKFQEFDKKLGNADTKKFRDYLAEHKVLIPELTDYKKLQQKLWLSYLQKSKSIWDVCVEVYETNKSVIESIVDQAKKESTTWEKVVEQFNRRFDVPFTLSVINQDDVILQGSSPVISFEFSDGVDEKNVNRDTLLSVLSQGERRALYILNILFEIEVRKQGAQEQLIIIDDIADSFDYKNKYAIIEYLRDLAQVDRFKLIILSHNFDFYRTISGRLDVGRPKKLFAIRGDFGIKLVKERYQKDVFSFWKQNLHQGQSYALASIAFARNVAEYSGKEADYLKLTSLLHIKPDSHNLTFSDLNTIYKRVFDDFQHDLQDLTEKVLDKIISTAANIVQLADDHIELESKVILAIAIRLNSEKYMIDKINDYQRVNEITSNQTRELFDIFRNDFAGEVGAIEVLDRVNLMTPENIHLNSFMYEPILDMSSQHLYRLHDEIIRLLTP